MADRIILYWRNILAQVIVRKGRVSEKRELPERFIRAIDACAMRVGAKDSEAYLSQWRRSKPQLCSDDLAAEAERTFAELDSTYDLARLRMLIANNGFEAGSSGNA